MTVPLPRQQPGAPADIGSTAGVASLFKTHGGFVWRTLRRLGVTEVDADDACQEVFVVVHRKLGEFEWRSSVQTWLYGICIRIAAEYRRRRLREAPSAPREEEVDPALHPQEKALATRQACAVLDRILGELDDDKREVFVLYEIEELSMTEVVAILGCPLQTAYSRLYAARRHVEAAVDRLRRKQEAP